MRSVRLLIDRAEMNGIRRAGSIISLPDDEAARCIRDGLAEPVQPEAAMSGAAECAMKKPPTPRNRR